MNDSDILALTELCNALADGRLTDEGRADLNRRLAASGEARQFYVRFAELGASLCEYAGEQQTEPAPLIAPVLAPEPRKIIAFPGGAKKWMLGIGALAASVLAAFVFSESGVGAGHAEPASVAWLTGATDAEWVDARSTLEPGDALERGQRLDLKSGIAEVTFDSGARVVLEGPASLDVESAWAAGLRDGSITASAPDEAAGFRVANAAVQVTQLGGDVRIEADRDGHADVISLRGAVEAAGPGGKLMLTDKEARRFARAGVTKLMNMESRMQRFANRPAIGRKGRAVKFARWSFDSAKGRTFVADTEGFDPAPLSLERGPEAGDLLLHTGRWRRALSLKGLAFGSVRLPATTPRMVAAWIRIPPNASVQERDAILEIGPKIKGLRVAWNRNPEHGPLGALRTEQAGSRVIGSTSLRDGRWHHVAVMWVGNKKAGRPEIRQYVDGKLEGSALVARRLKPNELRDTFFVGRRANPAKIAADEDSRGELDELIVADRPLSPYELRTLIEKNEMPSI